MSAPHNPTTRLAQLRRRRRRQRYNRAATVAFLAMLIALGEGAWQLVGTSIGVEAHMATRVEEFHASAEAGQAVPDTSTNAIAKHTSAPPEVGVPEYGETFGVLHVTAWEDMQIPITHGTGADVLDLGNAGHYQETQLPGEIGNFALAGHRRTHGNNFRRIDRLTVGDPLIVETANAYLVYTVIGHDIVSPYDVDVILPVPGQPDTQPTRRLLTLTTCHPEYGNSERYVVWAELAYWTDKTQGLPSGSDL